MSNCLVAQAGGPTAVINASLAGVIRANQLNPVYDRVIGGLYGVKGILDRQFFDLTNLSGRDVDILKQTPSSALGTCRFILEEDRFAELVQIMDENDVSTLFYIGGNGSLNTVRTLDKWARANGIDKRFVGIPKTVDNDLVLMDHCPGFASAAKVACQVAHATRLDYDAYTRREVFILETMGRDAGWLAASTCLTGDVDLLLLPEAPYRADAFMRQVERKLDETGSCYIVVAEGARREDGSYLSENGAANDDLEHRVLGGAANRLKAQIMDEGIAPRVVVQDLSRMARSSNFALSAVDVEEAYHLGVSAHMRSVDPAFSGMVVGVARGTDADGAYNAEYHAWPAEDLAILVRPFPAEWILPDYQGITDEALEYFRPLIQGEPKLICKNGIPETLRPFNKR